MIRTSGYYKNERDVGELIHNSDFELGIEGWKYEGWQYVRLPDFAVEDNVNTLYPEKFIEIYPEDLLMLSVSVKEITNSHPFKVRLKYYDKNENLVDYEDIIREPVADANITYNLLISPSVHFSAEWSGQKGSIRAVKPWIYVLKSDGWTTGEVLEVHGLSLRRIKPDWLKNFSVGMIDIFDPWGVEFPHY